MNDIEVQWMKNRGYPVELYGPDAFDEDLSGYFQDTYPVRLIYNPFYNQPLGETR